jgi:sigma54-dependent transcription regulator
MKLAAFVGEPEVLRFLWEITHQSRTLGRIRPSVRSSGSSAIALALESVLEQVEQVAPTDLTVFIEGETATEKVLFAHASHAASQRCGRAFIKLSSAAFPLDLLESELLSHEKGAFTCAIGQKIGRFEMAAKGTLFLDEVRAEGSRQATRCQQTASANAMPQALEFSLHHPPLRARSTTNESLRTLRRS